MVLSNCTEIMPQMLNLWRNRLVMKFDICVFITIWLRFHSITNLFLHKFNICGIISVQFDKTIRSWTGIFNKLMTFVWPYAFFIFSQLCW
jgi:hypothetical protein